MSSVLNNILRECADELDALEWFDDVPVLTEDRKDIEHEINRALGVVSGVKAGAFVVLQVEGAYVRGSAEFGPVFGEIAVAAQCVELPALNRAASGTQKTATEIAERVAAALIHFRPGSANGPVALRDPAITPLMMELGGGVVLPGFTVKLMVPGSLAVVKPQVASPVAVVSGGEVSLSCATPGAAIFYTTDGTKPGTEKVLYEGPFAPGPCVVRARGWLSGFVASEIVNQVVNQ